jgi:6-phosphogluconolactonase
MKSFMSIEIVDARHFAGAVADEVVAILNEAIAERGSASLALAGGSTPAGVYRALSKPPRTEALDWGKIRIYLGDERWVPASDDQSNGRMARETLLEGLGAKKPQYFPVDTSLSSVEEGAKSYSSLLRAQELPASEKATGIPALDLILLGMGEDGHTASLFPHSLLLKENAADGAPSAALCAVAQHPTETGKPGGVRITMLPKLILNARRILVLVSGENKASMTQRVLEGSEDASVLPVRILKDAAAKATWFLDSGAAKLLAPQR